MAQVLEFPKRRRPAGSQNRPSQLDERGVFMTAGPPGMLQLTAMRAVPSAGRHPGQREVVAEIVLPLAVADRVIEANDDEADLVRGLAQRLLQRILDMHDPIGPRIESAGGTAGGTDCGDSAGSGANS